MMKNNKVLFILHYPPPIHGASIIGGIIKESKFINNTFDCKYINLSTSTSIKDIGSINLAKVFRYFALVRKVYRQIKNFKPDLCYFTPTANKIGFYKDALIIIIVKLLKIRTIYHYHNKGIRARQDYVWDNYLYKVVFKDSFVVMLSKRLYTDVQKYIPKERVFYCANGIPSTLGSQVHFTRDIQSKQDFPNSSTISTSPELLFMSHLLKSKGVLVLINACKILTERNCNFHCSIVGSDADLTKVMVEEIIRDQGLESKVSVVGPKHGKDKDLLLNSVDILVHPTLNDCFPLILLEAMQYSLAVVSTIEGGIPDIVDDGITGFLVPKNDPLALADKLENLLKDPQLRRRMGASGRAKYECEFTVEEFESRMKYILKEVTSQN